MDQNSGNLPLTKGPTDSGGGPSITGNKTGKLENGQEDKEGHGCTKGTAETYVGAEASPVVKIIDITTLSEAELLDKTLHYVASMEKFALATRNVHREIKDTLPKLRMLLTQYIKVKKQGTGDKGQNTQKPEVKDAGKCAATQTPTPTNPEKPDGPLMAMLERIQEQLTSQQGSIDQLAAERNQLHLEKRSNTKQQERGRQQQQEQPTAATAKKQRQQQPKSPKQQQQQQKSPKQQQQREQQAPEEVQEQGRQQHEQAQEPQQEPQQQQQTWSEAVRKRKPPKPAQQPRPTTDQVALLRKRAPRSMAVTIDRPAEGGSLASVMKKVSRSINLQSLGVKVLTTRKTRAGGILLEVEGNEKATLLAGKIREVVGDAARVRLPEPRTPVLLLGIPEWAEAENVIAGVTQAGVTGVTSENVIIRKNSGGRGEFVASLHLPLKDAITLAERKTVTVEWTRCRVKLLTNNQPTCFRCQGKGHLAAECQGEVKPRRCHRCNKDDHLVKDCALQKQAQQKPQPQPSTSSCGTLAEASSAV
ncbi:unnamed protein product [Macrosiphum euphorbiae]|uniref:CCHC-type domain-containing protein n=1 Tax=Macrosiphum euphorbiae TaxID=13131 RepID=A0AAV0WYL6_9HEMI|nr:unnamed protein product [Macrosiphum euphorbiae]